MKKFQIIFDNNNRLRLGQKICIVYTCDNKRRIHLYNLIFVKSKNEFCLNRNIDLPKALIKRYDGAIVGEKIINEMKGIGIVKYDSIYRKIDLFNEKKDFISYSKYRNKLLGKSDKSSKSLEVIEEINNLRKELLMTNKDNETIFEIK